MELTLKEFANTLSFLIDNNKNLINNGDTPIAVGIEGEAGLGKTSVIEQVAKSKEMTFVKVNLAQFEEPAELIGYPYKEFELTKSVDDNRAFKWVITEDISSNSDWILTGRSRMSYATPSWLPREENENGTILLLDDFSRANPLIIQAVMEIINTGSYVSWKLPKYTNIVLTSNPDNGNYNVTSLDDAVKSRMITFFSKFNIKDWAEWAETFGINGRAINFALLYSEELFTPKNNVTIANARNYTTFCRAIGGINNWNKEESLALILQIASGCFLEKENVIGVLFTQFVNNNLDSLIQPEEMITGSWETVKKKVYDCVHSGGLYRANIASALGTRFLNYCIVNMGKGIKADVVEKRLNDFLTAEEELLSQDILYFIVKSLCSKFVAATNKWLINPNIRKIAF